MYDDSLRISRRRLPMVGGLNSSGQNTCPLEIVLNLLPSVIRNGWGPVGRHLRKRKRSTTKGVRRRLCPLPTVFLQKMWSSPTKSPEQLPDTKVLHGLHHKVLSQNQMLTNLGTFTRFVFLSWVRVIFEQFRFAVMSCHGNTEEANPARLFQYSTSDLIISFTPAPTPCSRSLLSHAHRSWFFFGTKPLPCNRFCETYWL